MNKQRPIAAASLLTILLATGFFSAQTAAQRGPTFSADQFGIVIDHDPMRMSVGSPLPTVKSGPRPRSPVPSPGSPVPSPSSPIPSSARKQVTPDPSLNQIVVDQPTPVSVFTGNTAKTGERLRLECYRSLGRRHGLLRLQQLTEGEHGDYSLAAASVPIEQGEADFTIRFHRSVLGPQHSIGSRTVYLVTFKDTASHQDDGNDCIQTVTILNDDPAYFTTTKQGVTGKQ